MTSSSGHDEGEPRASWSTLWLPLEARGPTWIATTAVGLAYLLTMSRDLSFFDSGELATVAVQGGLSHPPGHPLYAILGWLVTHIPGVPALLGLNALSAIPAALCLVPATSLGEAMITTPDSSKAKLWSWRRCLVPAIIALFALHPALWETASRIEVYALASFLALWSVAHIAACITNDDTTARQWLVAGLTLGLAAAVNPVVALAAALATTTPLILALRRRRLHWTRGLWLVGGGLVGLLPLVYIPLVAGRQDAFVWGAPTHGEALSRYLTGADFVQKKQELTGALMGQHAVEWLRWTVESGLMPLLALGAFGHLLLGKRTGAGRGCALLNLTLVVLFLSTNIIFLPEVPDFIGYQAVSLWLFGAGASALVVWLGADAATLRRKVLVSVLVAAIAVQVIVTPPWLFGRTRHRDHVARTLARGALESAPEGAIAIVSSDHFVFPLLYLQEVEGLRPDVVVIPRGLSGASWAWAHIDRRHPELHDFALRGPGGQPARIRRFLHANRERPVLYEAWEQAASIGRRPGCVGEWLLHDENACAEDTLPPDELTPAVDRSIRWVGQGSPYTDAVLARVSLDRGEMLWRLGNAAGAVHALRAGVPPERRPPRPTVSVPAFSAVEPLSSPLPRWSSGPIIGHYGQNLFVAARLLFAAGAQTDGVAHLTAAAQAELAEARNVTNVLTDQAAPSNRRSRP